jgi:hypothetical protein
MQRVDRYCFGRRPSWRARADDLCSLPIAHAPRLVPTLTARLPLVGPTSIPVVSVADVEGAMRAVVDRRSVEEWSGRYPGPARMPSCVPPAALPAREHAA